MTSGRCETLVTRLGDKAVGDDGRRAIGEEEVEREAVARSKKEQDNN